MEEKHYVLIVDDIQENLQLIGNILYKNGINVSSASSGKQALEKVKVKLPDLILLDISMPYMDGFEVCKKLKSEDLTKDVPIIFLTAKSQTGDMIAGLELGAVDYINKPFDPAVLLARVNTHLELSKVKQNLIAKNKELVELNATKDKFFKIIAHDLRSPLSSLLGGLSVLGHENNQGNPESNMEIVKMLKSSVNKGLKLLNNLMEWSSLQTNVFPFQPAIINLKELVEENVELLSNLAMDKSIVIDFNISKEVSVFADENMISSVIRNLVSNAIKFTNREGKIEVSSKRLEGFYEIAVKDNGVGIEEQLLDNMFKIDKTSSTKGTSGEKGTGLGLLLCKEFVEKHGGEIRVETRQGNGSYFYFTIPVKKGEAQVFSST